MVFRQMSLQIACLRWGIVTVITFVWLFSTMCPHTFLHSAFSNVSSICLPRKRHSHIGCICLAFLHCAFSNVYSNCFSEKRQSHIGCICWTFLHCVLSNVPSNGVPEKLHSHIGCICWSFLHCVSSDVSSNCLRENKQSHIDASGCFSQRMHTDIDCTCLNVLLHYLLQHYSHFY